MNASLMCPNMSEATVLDVSEKVFLTKAGAMAKPSMALEFRTQVRQRSSRPWKTREKGELTRKTIKQ